MSLPQARALWRAGRADEALAAAWAAYDAAPHGLAQKQFLTGLLQDHAHVPAADRAAGLLSLANDPDIDPASISTAGWSLVVVRHDIFRRAPPMEIAARLDANDLALALLTQDFVVNEMVEATLTQMRRWLLLANQANGFPRLSKALIAQAALNGGAWPFDPQERTALERAGEFARAYLPPRGDVAEPSAFSDRTIRAVAEQYEGWPYPQWKRITTPIPTTLAAHVGSLDPDGPDIIAAPAQILIAGCGTGRQVVYTAKLFPDARLTAIDISAASLRLAAQRCAAAGVDNVDFHILDLNQVATLGRVFDAVICTGVLHHLPDPEQGWAALTDVLKPGGIMHIMLYSTFARQKVLDLRQRLSPLAAQPMSDDLLRHVRRVLRATPGMAPIQSRDFYNLAGVYDLLMHQHEDPFDIPRLQRAMDSLGLKLIHFVITSDRVHADYHRDHPGDPLQRDFAGWANAERAERGAHARMYDFWCRKTGAA